MINLILTKTFSSDNRAKLPDNKGTLHNKVVYDMM